MRGTLVTGPRKGAGEHPRACSHPTTITVIAEGQEPRELQPPQGHQGRGRAARAVRVARCSSEVGGTWAPDVLKLSCPPSPTSGWRSCPPLLPASGPKG